MRTLLVGALGGALFALIGFPAPWLSGSMIAVSLLAIAGYDVAVPVWLRNLSLFVIGVQIGSNVTPGIIDQLSIIPVSLILLVLTVIIVVLVLYGMYRKLLALSPLTALFASLPGALSTIILLSEHYGANTKHISIIQTTRLFVLMVVIPLLAYISGIETVSQQSVPAVFGGRDLSIVVLACAVPALFALRMNFPAGILLGAMAVSAGLYLTAYVSAPVPGEMIIPVSIIMGCFVGSRFQNAASREMGKTIIAGITGALMAVAIAATIGSLAAYLTDMPLIQILLAFAPGGLEVMAILALTLGYDATFVGGLHAFRLLVMNIAVIAIAEWLVRRVSGGSD